MEEEGEKSDDQPKRRLIRANLSLQLSTSTEGDEIQNPSEFEEILEDDPFSEPEQEQEDQDEANDGHDYDDGDDDSDDDSNVNEKRKDNDDHDIIISYEDDDDHDDGNNDDDDETYTIMDGRQALLMKQKVTQQTQSTSINLEPSLLLGSKSDDRGYDDGDGDEVVNQFEGKISSRQHQDRESTESESSSNVAPVIKFSDRLLGRILKISSEAKSSPSGNIKGPTLASKVRKMLDDFQDFSSSSRGKNPGTGLNVNQDTRDCTVRFNLIKWSAKCRICHQTMCDKCSTELNLPHLPFSEITVDQITAPTSTSASSVAGAGQVQISSQNDSLEAIQRSDSVSPTTGSSSSPIHDLHSIQETTTNFPSSLSPVPSTSTSTYSASRSPVHLPGTPSKKLPSLLRSLSTAANKSSQGLDSLDTVKVCKDCKIFIGKLRKMKSNST